jgi:hypothetical protein
MAMVVLLIQESGFRDLISFGCCGFIYLILLGNLHAKEPGKTSAATFRVRAKLDAVILPRTGIYPDCDCGEVYIKPEFKKLIVSPTYKDGGLI